MSFWKKIRAVAASKTFRTILFLAGALLLGVPLIKSLAELFGMARYNTFGYIQTAMFVLGTALMITSLLLDQNKKEKNKHWITVLVFSMFFIFIFFDLPRMLMLAEESDQKMSRLVSTYGDDSSYQTLAINLSRGAGYIDRVLFPPESYHFDLSTRWGEKLIQQYKDGPIDQKSDEYAFFRAPGLPLMLSATYSLFGDETIVARQMMAILAWLTGILLLLLGLVIGGWLGAIAGGLAGIYHIHFYPGLYEFSSILSEIPAAFFITLFCLFLALFIKQKKIIWLVLSGAGFALLSFVRVNLFLTFPMLIVLFIILGIRKREIGIFIAMVLLVVGFWSTYASLSLDKLVIFTTQGGHEFPSFNNIDVLEGVGENHAGQGGWQAGKIYDENGDWIDSRYYAKTGENGWLVGFKFWFDNFEELPRLFYVKLRRGFFFDNAWSVNPLRPEGIHLIGIGYLLLALGFRKPKQEPCILNRLSSSNILLIQLILIGLLILIWNQIAFWLVCLIWMTIFILALARPYGDVYQTPYISPTWFLVFILCHAIITMLFTGYRYHWPIDPILTLIGLLGLLTTAVELFNRKKAALVVFILMVGLAGWFYYIQPALS